MTVRAELGKLRRLFESEDSGGPRLNLYGVAGFDPPPPQGYPEGLKFVWIEPEKQTKAKKPKVAKE